MSQPLFRYEPAILERYPSIVGGTLHVTGASNGPTSSALVEAYTEEQRATIARVGSTPLSELPSIVAWRRAFRAFGVDPTQYRSAAEALLRRLTKQGEIPSINTLVDIGNLVSIRHALPVAILDLASIRDGLTVRFADGDERFTDLGSGSIEAPEPGEVIFIDAAGHVAARRWCWRQSAESASAATTTDMLITVEGHHEDAREDVLAATADLEALIRAHSAPASIVTGLVDAADPAFEAAG
jgi:DNA/RNA-binding domain of Phe-tRNA-synthetase-like protein